MDLCVEHGVEPGSPIRGLSQKGQERGKKKKVRGEKYIIVYFTCCALKLNPLTSPVV